MNSAFKSGRGHRHREVPSETLHLGRQRRVHLKLVEPAPYPRPRTRGQCDSVARPCPYVGCAMNLYLDVLPSGNILLNFPDLEPEQMPANKSCALDLAEHGGLTLEETGEALNVTRERIRQIESRALRKLTIRGGRLHSQFFEHGPGWPDEGE